MFCAGKTEETIEFFFWGHDYLSAKKWVADIDRRVFIDQMETGLSSPHGEEASIIHPSEFNIMKHALEQGDILPNYGIIGGAGIHQFHFLPDNKFCDIEVFHPYVAEKWRIRSLINAADVAHVIDDPDPFRYSGFQYFFPSDSKPAFNENENLVGIKCGIRGREHASLRKWQGWNEELALAGRYKYIFSPTSIGIAVHVNDIENDTSVDVTDYNSW